MTDKKKSILLKCIERLTQTLKKKKTIQKWAESAINAGIADYH